MFDLRVPQDVPRRRYGCGRLVKTSRTRVRLRLGRLILTALTKGFRGSDQHVGALARPTGRPGSLVLPTVWADACEGLR